MGLDSVKAPRRELITNDHKTIRLLKANIWVSNNYRFLLLAQHC